ncbi:hypothetical protein [Tolypothrix sp. VBCCA 56010]|uniref:hypothetical protein n=1 Tax=Tolypothrix sp. VBCCA 56010 TaxID=3137731 RepID=UPI003D7EB07A
MGNGQWGFEEGKREKPNAQCPMPHAPCPMTADASSRRSRPTHCLPNAQCPMPNT